MLFNSYTFILFFLPITGGGYYLLNHYHLFKSAQLWLLAASLFFYGFFNWSYLPIILISILANYSFNRIIRPEAKTPSLLKKTVLVISILLNIGILFYFKYFDFFIQNINSLFGTDFTLLHLVLPLGISFFTFQQLSYVIDSYRGDVPNYPLLDYALFVTFFPQLIAGPIVLHDEMVPQFADPKKKKFNIDNFASGLMAFTFGLAKKVLIADTFAKVVSIGYANVTGLGTVNALIVMLSYTFQIYFDFSGYCDMATGIGKFFNIDIPMNFNSPYRAKTITEFWDRWHMTLTRFFTKYIYIPLGGNRKGTLRTYVNVMIVFFVSGIWHGANWTFILWGLMHGVASVITRIFKKQIVQWHPAFSWLCTFAFINVTWIFFRADSVGQAFSFIQQIYSLQMTPILSDIKSCFYLPEFLYLLEKTGHLEWQVYLWVGFMAFALIASLQMKNTNERLAQFKPTAIRACFTSLLFFWSVISMAGVSVFLYWNF